MRFVTISDRQEQLSLMSQLLLTAFPGCTIHQTRDYLRAVHHLNTQKVDAVFTDTESCSALMNILDMHNAAPSVYCLREYEMIPVNLPGDSCGVAMDLIPEYKIRALFHPESRNPEGELTA